jgi:hypothetical protein
VNVPGTWAPTPLEPTGRPWEFTQVQLGRRVLLVLILAAAVVAGPLDLGPSFLPGAAEPVVVVHVDADDPDADDANPGSARRPVRTVQRGVRIALDHNTAGDATRVVIHPGVYRETIDLPASDDATAAPMTLEGSDDGGVVISGADVWEGWSSPEGDGVYIHHWPFTWGEDEPPSSWDEQDLGGVLQRRELVFVDGTPLRQVGSADAVRANPGTFSVSEDDEEIAIHPLPGAAPPDAVVEVAVRPRVFRARQRENLSLRNLTFRHANTPLQRGAVILDGVDTAHLEGVTAEWNAWAGLAIIDSDDVTVTRSAANHNGILGFSTYQTRGLYLDDVENSSNNWRGAWVGYHGWEAGSKFFSSRDTTLHRFVAVNNRSHGLWLDYDHSDVVIDEALLAGNLRHGLFLEASQGPFVVRDSTICANGRAGVFDGKARQVHLEGNRVFGNGRGQLVLSGDPGGRDVTFWDTGTETRVNSGEWRLRDNRFGAVDDAPLVTTTLSADEWETFRSSLTSGGNVWSAAEPDDVFELPEGGPTDFTGWQEQTAQDRDSRFEQRPTIRPCPADPLAE